MILRMLMQRCRFSHPYEDPDAQHSRLEAGFSRPDFNRCERSCADAHPGEADGADAHPSFAIATIKPHDPNSNRQGFNATGERFTIRNQTIVSLMMFAYSIDKHQVVDAPAWAGADRFDIDKL